MRSRLPSLTMAPKVAPFTMAPKARPNGCELGDTSECGNSAAPPPRRRLSESISNMFDSLSNPTPTTFRRSSAASPASIDEARKDAHELAQTGGLSEGEPGERTSLSYAMSAIFFVVGVNSWPIRDLLSSFIGLASSFSFS